MSESDLIRDLETHADHLRALREKNGHGQGIEVDQGLGIAILGLEHLAKQIRNGVARQPAVTVSTIVEELDRRARKAMSRNMLGREVELDSLIVWIRKKGQHVEEPRTDRGNEA